MNLSAALLPLAASLLILAPATAVAGINKCVDESGQVTYSDLPCVNQGQKPAEVRNTTEFALMEAREKQRKLGQACMALVDKRAQCRVFMHARLSEVFQEGCEPAMRLERQERQREQYRQHRQGRYYEDSIDPYAEKPRAQLECGKLEEETYKFVKANFAEILSPDDVKAIEYKLMAIPSDGYERPLSTKNRKR